MGKVSKMFQRGSHHRQLQATIKGFGISSDQGDCSVRCQLKSVLHGVNEPPFNFLKNICASVHANLIPKIN